MEESTVWKGCSSQALNLGAYILCGLTCWLIVPIFIAIWKWIELRAWQYEITTERIHVTRGVFSKQIDDMELYRVKDITVLEPFLLRLFSAGDIVLQTSDRSSPSMILRGVPNPKELRDLIRKHVEACRDKKRVSEVDVDSF